jgi:hypothetical protein
MSEKKSGYNPAQYEEQKQQKPTHFDERNQSSKGKDSGDIYYKGVNQSTLEYIKQDGEIKAKLVEKAGQRLVGVYVAKSEGIARTYGDYILKIDLSGIKVVPSPHSNQFIAMGSIPAERIISVTQNMR